MRFWSDTPTPREIRSWLSQGKMLLIILEGKHGNQEAIATSEAAFIAFCLCILTERMETGDYYLEPEAPKKPVLTVEQSQALPEGKIRQAAMDEFASYRREMEYYANEKIFWDNATRAIKSRDGWLAYECLMERQDAEYEGIRISTPEVCK